MMRSTVSLSEVGDGRMRGKGKGKGRGRGKGVRLRQMAQRFHEQSEDRFLSFFLSFLVSRIGHHSPRYSREGQVTKASCKRSQRDGARRLGSFFFVCSRIDRLCLASSFADLLLL